MRSKVSIFSDLLVFLSLTTSALFMPALPDDGWILTRLHQLSEFEYHGNTYTAENTPMPQGFLYEYPLSKLISVLNFVHLRLVIAILLFFLWKYTAKNLISLREVNLIAIPAAIFSACAPIFLVSLRPEWLISFCVAVYLVQLQKMFICLNPKGLFLIVLIPIFAISIHQTGIVLIPSAILAVGLQCWRFYKEGFIAEASPHLLSALSLGIIVLTFKLNIKQIRESFVNFRTAEYYSGTELERARQFLQFSNPARALLWFLVVTAVFILILNLLRSPKSFLMSSRLHLLLILLSISLTTSKWAWHFGALIIPTVVVLSLLVDDKFGTSNVKHLRNVFYSALFLTVLVFYLSNIPAVWGTLDSSGIAWDENYRSIGKYLLMFIVLISILFSWLEFNRKQGSVRTALKLIILLFPLLSLTFSSQAIFIRDSLNALSADSEWNPGEQFLRELTFHDDCGIFSDLDYVSRVIPLGDESSNWSGRKPIASIDFNPSKLTKSDNTLSIYRINSSEDFTFDLSKLQPINASFGIWMKTTGDHSGNIVVFSTMEDSLGRRQVEKILEWEVRPDSNLQMFDFVLPKNVKSVKISVKNDEEVLLSNLAILEFRKFSQFESQGKGLKSPFTDVYTPCLQTNYSYYGTLTQPNFALRSFYKFENLFAIPISCRAKPFYCLYLI